MDREKSGKVMLTVVGDVATALATSWLIVGNRSRLCAWPVAFKPVSISWGRIGFAQLRHVRGC